MFSNFWSSEPWIRIRIVKKCWIRIRIRIRIETYANPKHWYRLICANPELNLLYHSYQVFGSASVLCGFGSSFLFFYADPDSTFLTFYADPTGSGSCSCSSSKRYESATAGLQTLQGSIWAATRYCVRHLPLRLHFEPLKLLNVHYNADPKIPNPAFQNNADPLPWQFPLKISFLGQF